MPRLDQLLVSRELASTRSRAQRLIKEGRVRFNQKGWKTAKKNGLDLPDNIEIEIIPSAEDDYVSRGALKLLGALEAAGNTLDLTNVTALDVGQSTGGFTDCLLKQGASKVVGIEVGHDQLATELKNDHRVICLEGYNARHLSTDLLNHTPEHRGFDVATMDVSFISQTLILDSLAPLLRPGGWLISLVKPQFELGPEAIGKGGIVRDSSGYNSLQQRIFQQIQQLDLEPLHYIDSPIKGGDGNHEFLLIARKTAPTV